MSRAIKKGCTICGKPFQVYLSKKDCRASMSPKIKKSPDAPNGTPGDLLIQALSKYFINAFQPVAYRCPAVMCLRCNVRQRKPLNVPQ